MQTDRQRKWVTDAVLYLGFLGAMLLDVTGLDAHQWLGVTLAGLAGYHLWAHWQWVIAVTRRFLSRTGGQARIFYLVDVGMLGGFLAIGATGLVISTWLNLPLPDYPTWRDAHVISAVATLGLVVLKIGLHWRWIAGVTAGGLMARPRPASTPASTQSIPVQAQIGRRHFVSLVGSVGATALLVGTNALIGDSSILAVATVTGPAAASVRADEPAPCEAEDHSPGQGTGVVQGAVSGQDADLVEVAATPTATPSSSPATASALDSETSVTKSCTVQCPIGCWYPGRCRRYIDTNATNRCDLGECGT